jgi:hypothetical protein
MNEQPSAPTPLVISYLGLRKAVGIIGIALPFVLAIGKVLVESPGLEMSMSAYYYTDLRNVFVGSLCAISVFLMSYRGYDRRDHVAGILASIFGVGVAMFPTAPEVNPTSGEKIIGGLHFLWAALFLLTLAYFSLALFTLTDAPGRETPRKLERNVVYRVCGWTILACLILGAVVGQLPADSPVRTLDPLFWLEALAVVAFGVSWLTKGEAILKDQ